MVRKTTSTKSPKAAAPKKAEKRPAKRVAVKRAATSEATKRPVYALQVGNTFTLLTQQVGGGAVTVQQPIAADSVLQLSYWKEPQQLARPDSQFVSVMLHSRIDGVEQPVQELGHVDGVGRFVRTTATVDLPAATQHFEYWFEIATSAGEMLWDSNWGNNYWLDIASHGSLAVEVLYDASMDSSSYAVD